MAWLGQRSVAAVVSVYFFCCLKAVTVSGLGYEMIIELQE